MQNGPAPSKGSGTALKLFALLLTIYLLTFSGTFTAIDELALYARTEAFVQTGSFSSPLLAFAAVHNPVGATEPGFSFLAAPFYWLAKEMATVNNFHVVMLLNPILTAATASLVYAVARLLQHSRRASLLAAFAYALATLAWPYARSFYREPLVALGWAFAFYGLLRWRLGGSSWWTFLSALVLGLLLLVKATAVVGVPFLLLLLFFQNRDRAQTKRYLLVLGIAAAAGLVLFLLVFRIRFGTFDRLLQFSGWSPLTGALRVYGQLLSPGKGLIFYMPVALLFIPGFVALWRRHWSIAIAALGPLLGLVAFYSAYAAWYGGQSWGPRFLVPALPLAMISLAALWDGVRRRPWRAALLAVVGLSFVFQLSVAVSDWWAGYQPLLNAGPQPEDTAGLRLADFALSPPLVQLLEWQPATLNLLWFHPDPGGFLQFAPYLAAGLALAVLVALVLWALSRRRPLARGWFLLPPALGVAALLLFGAPASPGYPGIANSTARQLATWVRGAGDRPYTVVTVSNEFQIYRYAGFLKGDFIHHWYSPAQKDAFTPLVQHTAGERVALVVDRVHITPEHSGKELEWWLNGQLFRGETTWVEGFEAINYRLPAGDLSWNDIDYRFGEGFLLDRYAVGRHTVVPGEVLRVALDICRQGPLPDYHQLFLHLWTPQAQIPGYDGPVRYGQTFTEPWPEGECLVERRVLDVPVDAGPGRYRLIAGFTTPDGPLPAYRDGAPPADYLVLDEITVGTAP